MNAREMFIIVIQAIAPDADRKYIEKGVDGILEMHAHELAEEIRRDLGGDDLYPRERETGALLAADLIDPEVEK